MVPLRPVIGTNVLVSTAIKPAGLQRTVLLLAITKPARFCVSPAILEEYSAVLARPELKIRKGLRQQLLQLIRTRVTASYPRSALKSLAILMTISSLSVPMRPAPITWSPEM